MADIGAGWERVVLSWADIQPDGPGDFSWLGRTLPPRALAGELNRGVHMAGLLQFTPDLGGDQPRRPRPLGARATWICPTTTPTTTGAASCTKPCATTPVASTNGSSGTSPSSSPTDAAAATGSYTWLGTDEQFARLMEVAYRAAKRANPRAIVAFPGTSYWVDQNSGRPQFYERFLRLEAANPAAPAAATSFTTPCR